MSARNKGFVAGVAVGLILHYAYTQMNKGTGAMG